MGFAVTQLAGFGAGGVVVFSTIYDASAALTTETDAWTGYTVRVRLAASGFSGTLTGASQIRFTIKAGTSQGTTFDKCYVGHQSGSDAWDAASLTQVLFAGAAGVAMGAGTTTVSDGTSFSYDGTSDIIVTFHINGSSSADMLSYNGGASTSNSFYHKSGVDEAATADASGYGSSPTSLVLVQKVELGR